MKLNKDFITHETEGEQIMVSVGNTAFAGLVRSNRTAAFLVECLKKEMTKEQLIETMLDRYDAPRETIERDVQQILSILRSIGALDE